MTGYQGIELIDRTLAEMRILPSQEEGNWLHHNLEKGRGLRSIPIEFITKSDEARTGIMPAEIIELWRESCMLATIEDVTEAHRLEKEIMDISEKERLGIGQDLHDDLYPHLIGIEVLCKVLKRKLVEKGVNEVALAEKIRSLTQEAIGKTRSLARGLCPVNMATHGLNPSIEDLVHNVTGLLGVTCNFLCNCPVVFHDNATAKHL